MSNTEPKKTIVELFNEGKVPDYKFEFALEKLLSGRTCYSYPELRDFTLKDFQDNFEWDETYWAKAHHDIFVNPHTVCVECSSMEEALLYKSGEKEMEEPSLNDYYPDFEYTGDVSLEVEVEVDNLRLKVKEEPKKKSWKVSLDIIADDNIDMNEFVSGLNMLLDKEKVELIKSDFHQCESMTPGWEEVVGQK